MGAWVVYGTTEMGATVDLSWLGVIGYSAASACPAVIISLIGPHIREMSGEDAFGTTDFAKVSEASVERSNDELGIRQ